MQKERFASFSAQGQRICQRREGADGLYYGQIKDDSKKKKKKKKKKSFLEDAYVFKIIANEWRILSGFNRAFVRYRKGNFAFASIQYK